MRRDLENMVPPHCPRVLKDPGAAAGEMNLLAVLDNGALSRSDGPNEGDVMFLSTTFGSSETALQSLHVGEPKAPIT